MDASDNQTGILTSEFADDAEMVELVEMFVQEMPVRVASFQKALEAKDLQTLKMLAHQLKGSAGGYGFPAITEAAKELEAAAKAAEGLEKLEAQVRDIVGLCRRASAVGG